MPLVNGAAAVVGTGPLAAVGDLGPRRVAELSNRPATTVRDWIRRARTNSEAIWSNANVAAWRLDPNSVRRPDLTGSALGDMVGARSTPAAAWQQHFGPVEDPWTMIV